MELQEKLAALEDIMELDQGALTPETSLEAIEEWDSLAALSFVVLLTDEFNKKVTGQEIRSYKMVQDLLNAMSSAE